MRLHYFDQTCRETEMNNDQITIGTFRCYAPISVNPVGGGGGVGGVRARGGDLTNFKII